MAKQEGAFFVEEADFMEAVQQLAVTEDLAEAHQIVQWATKIVSATACCPGRSCGVC